MYTDIKICVQVEVWQLTVSVQVCAYVCVFCVTMQRHWQKEEEKADADTKQISERMLTVVFIMHTPATRAATRAASEGVGTLKITVHLLN